MRYIPEQKNARTLNLLFALLLLFGGVTYAVPIVCEANGVRIAPFPFTFLTLIAVVAAVFLLIRYRMTTFTYIIRPRSDVEENGMETVYVDNVLSIRPELLDLVVVKAQGQRPGAMESVLSLGDLAAVVPIVRRSADGITKKDVRKRYETKAGGSNSFVFYDYTVTLFLPEALELVFVDGNRYVGVILEPDEALTRYLTRLKPGGLT